ncbi:sensor histidine kinase [Stenoxybacter acetivorans]|uniref:sensor histidine kinase n=1 Tax=Stenoxybacter acetivorans TaxID=422441 RepID=UPI0005612566|nr:ATP-binding protein [Stenoxybacter acetivorans]
MPRSLLIAVLLSLFTLLILTAATGSSGLLADYFWWIFSFGAVLLLVLLAWTILYARQLFHTKRRQAFGSQIARRLALMFTLIAVLPGLFLFGVSAQFISHSINSWFGNDVAEALDRSLNLSQSALDFASDNSFRRAAAVQVQLIAAVSMGTTADSVLHEYGKTEAFSQLQLVRLTDLHIQAAYNPQNLSNPEISQESLKELTQTGSLSERENINHVLYAQGWLMLPENGESLALFFRQPIPKNVAEDATLIELTRAKYAELKYAKRGLQIFFLMTLFMATLLAVMLSLLLALYFTKRFSAPILSLSEGALAVARGDLSQKRPIFHDDELGNLTKLFNHMTEQLRGAHEQQTAARLYLEHVLNSLNTGVITFDSKGCLKTHNHKAQVILGQDLDKLVQQNIDEIAAASPQMWLIAEVLNAFLATENQENPIQLTYNREDDAVILIGKATELPTDGGKDTVLVFDDVTALIRAQKEAAWGEVARRLAHEIRNPLTPIQLSAERLAHKLSGKLNEADAHILMRSTDTIVKQVSAMKDLVEAFRNYAHARTLNLTLLDINELIQEILVLYESGHCTFLVNLSNMPLLIYADNGAMRQVLHNVLKNAAEAAAVDAEPTVLVSTQAKDKTAVIAISNNGKNFSQDMLARAFDPYITDKNGGTGLGLPVVKKIVEEHGGRVQINNLPEGRACIKITLPLAGESNAKQ